LRAAYRLLIIGLGVTIWPSILNPAKTWEMPHGVVACMLGAVSLLALIGIRHPLRMLPLLLWELIWKLLWLVRIALPMWAGRRLDAAAAETAIECLMVILIVVVIPWDHVFRVYVRAPRERRTGRAAVARHRCWGSV
jgi:uncharacterized membrane protein